MELMQLQSGTLLVDLPRAGSSVSSESIVHSSKQLARKFPNLWQQKGSHSPQCDEETMLVQPSEQDGDD